MNKRIFIIVIVLISVALTGIIGVQILWINNAISIKNDQFDRTVIKALNKVVEKIEEQRNIQYITNAISPQHYNHDTKIDTIITQINSSANQISSIKISASDNNFNSDVKISINPKSNIFDKNSDFDQPTLLGDSLNRLLISSKIDSVDKIINEHIASKFNGINGLLEKMIIEFNISSGMQKSEIGLINVKELIKNELNDNGIGMQFEFAIIGKTGDSISDCRSENFTKKYLNSKYKVHLFPNDVFNKNEFLIIDFPNRYSAVFDSISILLFASIFFNLIIILTFWIIVKVIIKQKKISEIKSDFINNMTHEFKTPIATISLAVDSIKNPKIINNKESILRFTSIIKEENKRMNRQVESVLQMSLLEKQDFYLKLETLHINELILDAVKNISLQIEIKNGKISTDLDPNNPVLKVDPLHFSNVIFNLLDNANKYSPIDPRIKISSKIVSKGLTISIEDNGIGINKSEQSRVFDKFFRVHTGDVHNVKGFGLGLSYVSAIVKEFGGIISVNSEIGKGSKFEMFFPK